MKKLSLTANILALFGLLSYSIFLNGCGKSQEDDFLLDENIQDNETSAEITPQERIDQYKKLLEVDPADYQVRNNLGVVYAQLHLFDEAVAEFEQVIKTKPDYTTGMLNLACTYGDMGKIDKAIEMFKKILEINPKYTKAHQNIAVAYYQNKNYKEATESFSKFVELNNDTGDESTFYTLADSYRHLKDLDNYKKYLNRVLEVNPNNELAKSELQNAETKILEKDNK